MIPIVEEVLNNIYRIGVQMPKNPLREVNCYFIRGEERDLLIDTCFRRDECRGDLDAGLAELKSDRTRRDILLTHLHSDHSGLANEYVGENRCIYLSAADISTLRDTITGDLEKSRRQRMLEEGFPQTELDESYATNPARIMAIDKVGENFRAIADGDEIHVGGYTLKAVSVPGHTPGNTMYWMEREKVMLTGDHILFDVTPNIMVWPGVEDSLGNYLDNLRRSADYPVVLALPGHRKTGNYHERIEHLLHHHDERIGEALSVVKTESGLNAFQIAERMTWKIRADNWQSFPVIQKWFAVGECLSHLDYLRMHGKVTRQMLGDCWIYNAV